MNSFLWIVVFSTAVVLVASVKNPDVQHEDEYMNTNDITSILEDSSQGRNYLWNNFQNIFRKITSFLGFPRGLDRELQEPKVVRRPEMLPMEMLYSKNRRSGKVPPRRREPLERRLDKKVGGKRLFNRRIRPTPFEHRRKKVDSNNSPFYNPQQIFSDTSDQSSVNNQKKTSFKVVHLPKEGIEPGTKYDPIDKPYSEAKIVSREPVVTVYTNNGARKTSMKKIATPIHSKFSINNYGQKRKKLSNSHVKNPTGPIYKNYESYVVGSSFSHNPKKKPVFQKPQFPKSQFPKSNLGDLPLLKPHSIHLSQEETIRPFFLTPPRQSAVQIPKEPKSLFDNVSGMASTFFKRFFPGKSEVNPVRRVRTVLDHSQPNNFRLPARNSQNRLRVPDFNSLSSHNLVSLTGSHGFDASPKEGSMSADAFQPIFNPSPSLDQGLPHNAMKPMSIIEKREHKIVPSGLTKPKIVNFFESQENGTN